MLSAKVQLKLTIRNRKIDLEKKDKTFFNLDCEKFEGEGEGEGEGAPSSEQYILVGNCFYNSKVICVAVDIPYLVWQL
jgi:hypothetical protein